MSMFFRSSRSAGIKVSAETRRRISCADRARDEGDWRQAAALYRLVLEDRPDLVHIRIQHAHSLKESGQHDAAGREYAAAASMAPNNRDAFLQSGHFLKEQGLLAQAAERYVSLALRDPDDEEAMREARDVVIRLDLPQRVDFVARLTEHLPLLTPTHGRRFPAIERCEIVYDASDLLSYFNHARRPTGIQRVQIETLVQALEAAATGGRPVGLCAFLGGRDEWVELPAEPFLELARLSVADRGDEEKGWRRLRDRLHLWLLVAPPFEFAVGATLVNLGTSWWLQNYFLRVRDAQVRRKITYIPMIYDMIPVLFPDYCIDALVQDFIAWLRGVFTHSRTFMAISEASKRDLIATAARLGHAVDPGSVIVIPLDADFAASSASTSQHVLSPPDLIAEPFVLFVSTIEPRKGHLVAFEAWSRLLERLPAGQVPRLICVGRDGWRNAAVYERLSADPRLQERVVMTANLSDAVLAELYRRSLFTIYPSLYEGWGLPVTEALCRSKVVITTTSSSLPEAGGDCATFVAPDDPAALADAAALMILEPQARAAMERRIARNFRPRSWQAITEQIGDAVIFLRDEARRHEDIAGWTPPVAVFDKNYWLGRSYATELREHDDSGENFRAGLGWLAPEGWGCSTSAEGGQLVWRPSLQPGSVNRRVTVEIRLIGKPSRRSGFELITNVDSVRGVLARREHLTVFIEAEPDRDGRMVVCIGAGALRPEVTASDVTQRPEGVGVSAFMVRSPRISGASPDRDASCGVDLL